MLFGVVFDIVSFSFSSTSEVFIHVLSNHSRISIGIKDKKKEQNLLDQKWVDLGILVDIIIIIIHSSK